VMCLRLVRIHGQSVDLAHLQPDAIANYLRDVVAQRPPQARSHRPQQDWASRARPAAYICCDAISKCTNRATCRQDQNSSHKEVITTRLLMSAALVAGWIAPISAADAATAHRHRQHDTSQPMAQRSVGPPWAGPNQCFEDLGYGRYELCDW
jgi:hypothetical protein